MAKPFFIFVVPLLLQGMLTGCVKVENTTPRYDKDACVVCNRTGYESEAGKCSFCKGSAVCQFCEGKGKRLQGKKDRYYEAVCAFCQGNGKCHYCSGTGKCSICKGTGKYTPLTPPVNAEPRPDSTQPQGGR